MPVSGEILDSVVCRIVGSISAARIASYKQRHERRHFSFCRVSRVRMVVGRKQHHKDWTAKTASQAGALLV